MATTVDKIKEIEAEMSKTQKNKATNYHLGQLKAKLAKLKRELLTPSGGGGGGGAGFDVARTGVASIGFIGFPSVGKSTLMSRLTGQHSEAAAYEFTVRAHILLLFKTLNLANPISVDASVTPYSLSLE